MPKLGYVKEMCRSMLIFAQMVSSFLEMIEKRKMEALSTQSIKQVVIKSKEYDSFEPYRFCPIRPL